MKRDYVEELKSSFAQWKKIYRFGENDPLWEDGVNLNLVRNHILYYKGEIEKSKIPKEDYPDEYYWELPPKVSPKYMAREKEILKDFERTVKAVANNKYYLWLKENEYRITDRQKKEIHFDFTIHRIEHMLQQNNTLVVKRRFVRRYKDYLGEIEECYTKTQEILQNKTLPSGQLSIFDLLKAE